MSNGTQIQIVSYKQFSSISKELGKLLGEPSKDGYEIWKRYHDELCEVARRFGKFAYTPREAPDFYHSGDWFHEQSDGFMISDPRNLSPHVFAEFQEVVAKHHPNASMILAGGDTKLEYWGSIPPLFGLQVFIRPSTIHVAWIPENRGGCIRKMRDSGVDFEHWEPRA
jgi:hypothetical protein